MAAANAIETCPSGVCDLGMGHQVTQSCGMSSPQSETTNSTLHSALHSGATSPTIIHSGATSPTSPQHVDFIPLSNNGNTNEKEKVRFLTAKYPKGQMGLIRKRIAVEDWIDAELKTLFNVSDEDYETYDTILDLDDLLNCDTDSDRTQYIQQRISHAPTSPEQLDKFTEELLQKASTL